MALVSKATESTLDATDTVKAIITNLENILSTTIGFNLEYDIADDETVSTTPGAILHYQGEAFEDNFNERPKYNEISFLIMARFRESDPAEIRDRGVTYLHQIRDNVKVDTINVGALLTSQVVSWVDHVSATLTTGTPITDLEYEITIRYRES